MKSVGLTEKQLRKLTKMVLSEISLPPGKHKSFSNILSKLDAELQNNPMVKSPKIGHQVANEAYSEIIREIKKLVKATVKGNKDEIMQANLEYKNRRGDLLHVMRVWRDRILEKDPDSVDELHKLLMEFSAHISQIEQQTQRIYASLVSKGEGSQIIAYRQLQHLNQIINNCRETTDAVFKMALKLGLGKEK